MEISVTDIMWILARSRRPKTGREIAVTVGAAARQKQAVYRLLHDLVRQGEVRKIRGGKFVLPKQKRPLQGKIRLLRNGSGVVVSADGRREIRVPERALFGAMSGDLVEVVMAVRSRGNRPEGRVLRVLKRELKELIGLYKPGDGQGCMLPIDADTSTPIRISGVLPPALQQDQVIVVQLQDGSTPGSGPTGYIVEIIGNADDPAVEMLVIARRFGIPTTFPESVITAAHQLNKQVAPEEAAGRKDLRHLPFVTIDGETAKDFDDAVTMSGESSGHCRLLVAIADVAHYVPENSLIDDEALQRGTSVYLPGTCLPMLPEALSNGICSLKPQVDRLVLVVEILFDQNAVVVDVNFSEAVIRSRARLTYTAVQQFLDRAGTSVTTEPYLRQLLLMQDLAISLTRRRLKRGALDLDIPAAEIRLDTAGQPESIIRLQRTMAHRLIEEFMLAANEAVATLLTAKGFPLLYRIHEPPAEHDLEPFFNRAKRLGAAVGLRNEGLLSRLQKTLASVTGKTEQGLLNRLLLRSLKQACYYPENRGHFGLASEYYCHFTSPIRRYPDLLVHRMLKRQLSGVDSDVVALQTKKKNLLIAEQTSKNERRAIDAERDASAMKTCQFMVQHVGETQHGHVTSVHPFGFFVELDALFVEGLVHVSSLADTYYRFDDENGRLIGEGTNTVYAIGTPVTIVVRAVNVQRREIDFKVRLQPDLLRRSSFKKKRKRKI